MSKFRGTFAAVTSKQWVLLLLVIIFLLPGLSAYWFYTHPAWLSQHTTNKGQLITPPLLTHALAHDDKWHLILWKPGSCDQDCQQQLHQLSQIRMALGRRFYEIQLNLVTSERISLSPELEQTLDEQHIVRYTVTNSTDGFYQLRGGSQVLIANPQHFLILSYPLNVDSANIFNDLKRLIK